VSAGADARTEARIAELVRAGEHAQAAGLAARAGAHARAAELYATVWAWKEAADEAARAELHDEAFRYALASDDRRATEERIAILADHPDQALRAAEHAASKGHLVDAARLREHAGEVAGAAALFEKAGELAEAARCLESEGRYRDAGRLYERRVREAPDDAPAALALGRILVRFGRHEHAVRALQKAVADPALARRARTLLVACFDALGMNDAAGATLDELRGEDPSLPPTVRELLERARLDAGPEASPAAGGGTSAAGGDDRSRWLAGRYRIVRPLGAGATGRVLCAHDAFYDREVAVKVLAVADGSASRDAFTRFAKEARVAAGVDDPHVVRVLEFNPEGPFIVMELMAGGTLEDRLGRVGSPRALALAAISQIMLGILAGLEAVHRRGVVHRDLKPANVFFGAAGEVKIGDFGVAHLADLGATLTGAMLGTLAYMSPEQITGSRQPDASTDLYALGVILFRCLTGALPFPGPDFVTQHLQGAIPAPSAVDPSLGDTFDALVRAMLAKEPADRPRTAADARALVEGLAWVEPEGAPEPRVRPASLPPAAPGPASVADERYVPEGDVHRDRWLGRRVRIVACDAARVRALRAFAACDGPFLQTVLDVDELAGRAVLEEPSGAAPTEPVSARARSELADALGSLHTAGLVHGAIDRAHVRVGAGRAVLLLPDTPGTGSREADLAALARR